MDVAHTNAEKQCEYCGAAFGRRPGKQYLEALSTFKARRYCSKQCSNTARNKAAAAAKRITKSCIICGSEFSVSPSTARKYSTCSPQCLLEYRKHKVVKANEASRSEQALNNRRATYASKRTETPCGCGCGKLLQLAPYQLRNKRGLKFANREHYEAWFKGANVLWWAGGQKDYRGPDWQRQRRKALRRDQVCQHCGVSEQLVVHHIRYYRDCTTSKQANRLSNLKVLCVHCHMQVHAKDHERAEQMKLKLRSESY